MNRRTFGKFALSGVLLLGCGDTAEPESEGKPDAGLRWDQGGEDIPEYSLARVLVSDAKKPSVTVVDLDSAMVVGSVDVAPGARVMTGSAGRYSYVHDPKAGILHVMDPGQWLLSHIDHFHIVPSELGLRHEQVEVGALASFASHEGWIAVLDGERGRVSVFQERSLTAKAFDPVTIPVEPHRGVALVSQAHVLMSERAEDGIWGIGVRDAVDPTLRGRHVAGCSAAEGIVADDKLVFVACAEGVLRLHWLDTSAGELEAELFAQEDTERAPRLLRTNPGLGAVLFDGGNGRLMSLDQEGSPRELTLDRDIVDIQIRRQGTAALVLTHDGTLREVRLPELKAGRALQVADPLSGNAPEARFTLSHAYAYVADTRTSHVQAVRLSTLELEDEIRVEGAPLDIVMAGMPFNYTDDRE